MFVGCLEGVYVVKVGGMGVLVLVVWMFFGWLVDIIMVRMWWLWEILWLVVSCISLNGWMIGIRGVFLLYVFGKYIMLIYMYYIYVLCKYVYV